MNAKLTLENGKIIDVVLNDEQIKALMSEKKKTGYERVNIGSSYYICDTDSGISSLCDVDDNCSEKNRYYTANYYSDKTVAENNARADKLMRQLRRFAVENAENELNWKNTNQCKYFIYYDYELNRISSGFINPFRDSFQIYFDTKETAQKAIKTFKDELMWYFTEYRDKV